MPVTVCEFESRPGHSENGLQITVSHFSFSGSQQSVSRWTIALNFLKSKTRFSYSLFSPTRYFEERKYMIV